MTSTLSRTALLIGSLALSGSASVPDRPPVQPSPLARTAVMPGVAPYFEANEGQAAHDVKFLARARDYRVFLTSTAALMTSTGTSDVIRMQFAGANAQARVVGLDELPGKVNYLHGARKSWHTNVPTYASVAYRDLYPGVDLMYYAGRDHLEYDFIVGAGADPSPIILDFENVHAIELTPDGDLQLHTETGIVRHAKAVVYQQIGAVRRRIESQYVLKSSRQVGFALGTYDRSRPLIIDPTLTFSSYLGGSTGDSARRVAVDAAGNIYFTGTTDSLDFPTANAVPIPGGKNASHALVVKVSADGSTLLYATYFGGTNEDIGRDIAIDSAGGVYICGLTRSPDFPTFNALQPTYGGGASDAFVGKLDIAGDAFVYLTFLGGSDFDAASTLAVDTLGQAYVAGDTNSTDFPTQAAFQKRLRGNGDAFVTKLTATGSALVYSTYLGGVEEQGLSDFATGIALNAAGNAFVVGTTGARSFPTHHAYQAKLAGASDAFVTELSVDGRKLVYSTFLGGSQPDTGRDIALDAEDRITIVGHTVSTDFPTKAPIQAELAAPGADAFVAQFEAGGAQLRFSTYLGGTGGDFAQSMAMDPTRNIYVVGITDSADFPIAAPIQATYGGNFDAFVTKITSDGTSLLYSTYLGGSEMDDGTGIAADAFGNAYVTGSTMSFDFPIVNALQPTHSGVPGQTFPSFDMFFAKIAP